MFSLIVLKYWKSTECIFLFCYQQGISVTSHFNTEAGEQFISAENHSSDLRLGSLLRVLGMRIRDLPPSSGQCLEMQAHGGEFACEEVSSFLWWSLLVENLTEIEPPLVDFPYRMYKSGQPFFWITTYIPVYFPWQLTASMFTAVPSLLRWWLISA